MNFLQKLFNVRPPGGICPRGCPSFNVLFEGYIGSKLLRVGHCTVCSNLVATARDPNAPDIQVSGWLVMETVFPKNSDMYDIYRNPNTFDPLFKVVNCGSWRCVGEPKDALYVVLNVPITQPRKRWF